MKRLLVSLAACLFLLVAALPVCADEQTEPDLAADAAKTEKNPPTIPHEIKDDADGASCNTCHTAGFKAPHPERLNCTQCHVPGAEQKPDTKPVKKKKTKK